MKRIRIGKDISMRWEITTDGVAIPLDGRDLTVEIKSPMGIENNIPYRVEGNILIMTYYGYEQKRTGEYSITLWEKKGKPGQNVVDVISAFKLVRTSQEEDDFVGGDLQIESVDLGTENFDILTEGGYRAINIDTLQAEALEDSVNINGKTYSNEPFTITLPKANLDSAGVMSADDKRVLQNHSDIISQINSTLEEHTESINSNITTDRIENGAVTTEKIATSAFDSTLSVSGKIAPADIVGEKLNELEREIGKESHIVKSAPEDASGLSISSDKSTIVEALNVGQTLIFFVKKARKYLFNFNTQYTSILAYKTSVMPSVGVVIESIRIYKNQETIFGEDLYLLFSYNKSLNPDFSVEMLAPETGIKERLTLLENKAPDIIVDTLLPDVPEDNHVPSTKLFAEKIKDVTNIIKGEHTIEKKFEAPIGTPVATVNNLNDGVSYNLKVSINATNWIRIGFGKTESATFADADNYKSIFQSSTIGEYNQEIVAPSKEEYPYIISYRGINDNTAEIVKETETDGLESRISKAEQDIEQLKNNPNSDVLDKSQTIVFTAAQTIDTRKNPITCDIKKDDIVYLDLYGYNVPYVNLMVREKGTSTFTSERLTQENSVEVYLNKGDRHWFRASKNIDAIAFWVSSSVVNKDGSFHVRVRNPKSLEVSSQLKGRKILMFGDSITQMPVVKGAIKENCKGIVEFFSEITGAEAIRCAIGGTCISRKGEITDGVKDREDASRAKQICSMVEYSMTGKQEYLRQAADLTIDDGSETTDISTKDILYTLANIDMNTVDAITIFGGTNDSTAGVQLSSDNDFDYTTVRGGLNTLIKAVNENYPHIRVFIFTPIVRYYIPDGVATDEVAFSDGNWCDNYVLPIGKKLSDYADEIIATAKENHIPVCDLYREMNWNKDTFKRYLFRKAVGTNIDGTHPRFGFEKIAEKMASFIVANW